MKVSPHYGLDPFGYFEKHWGLDVQFPTQTMDPYKKNLNEPEDQR